MIPQSKLAWRQNDTHHNEDEYCRIPGAVSFTMTAEGLSISEDVPAVGESHAPFEGLYRRMFD